MPERSEHPRLARQVGAREGAAYNYEGERVMLRREVAGTVDLPSGELLLCDPRNSDDAVVVRVPPGSYRAYVTSFRGEYAGVHDRITATLAIRLRETGGITFAPLGGYSSTPASDDPDDVEDDGLQFVGIDGPSVYAADRAAWSAYDDGVPPALKPTDAIAEEITLPDGSVRVVRASSGFGSGGYPVFGGFDTHGDLAVVYVSFDLVFEGERMQEPWIGEDAEIGHVARRRS
ncbi:MAG: DUF4241 domain-containing protein [Nocardioidaceae bacterium]